MHNLRVELDTVDSLLRILHSGDRAYRAFCNNRESCRKVGDSVGVAHPAGGGLRNALENLRRLDRNLGSAVLAGICGGNRSAERVGSELCAVADAKHRNTKLKDAGIHVRGVFGIHTCRSSGKDDTGVVSCFNLVKGDGARLYLAEDICFADTAGN